MKTYKVEYEDKEFNLVPQKFPRFKNPQILSGGMNCGLKT